MGAFKKMFLFINKFINALLSDTRKSKVQWF